MKKILSITIIVIITLGIGGIALASDISEALYYGVIRASNSGALAEDVAANVSINTPSWIANGFVNSSVNNTAVRAGSSDVPFQPGYDTNPWIVYFDSIPAGVSSDVRLYTNTTGGAMRYFPDTTGMTTSDSIIFGDNFTITLSNVFINTSLGEYNIWYVTDSIYLYTDSTAGKINLLIKDTESSGTVYLRPNAAGDLTQIQHETANPHYEQVDESSPDDDTTKVYQNDEDGTATDLYHLSAPGFSGDGQDTFTVTHYYRAREDSGGFAGYGYAEVKLGSSTFEGSQDSHTTSYANYSESVTRPGGGTWVSSDFDDIQAGIKIYAVAGGADHVTQVYLKVDYTYWDQAEVSVSGISSGEYDIIISADGTDLSLDVGGTNNSTALGGVSAANTANDIISFENNVVLYAGSQEIEIDGVQKQYVEWEYNSTFTDQSGNGNHATPTFRTTSSDADVSAELISFQPISEAAVDSETASSWPTVMEDPPELPDTTFTEEERPGIFFEPLIHTLASVSDLPDSLFWYNFAFTIIIGAGIIVYYILAHRKEGTAGGSGILFVKIATQAALMCFFAIPGLNIYGFFVPLYYLFFSSGMLILSRDYGW